MKLEKNLLFCGFKPPFVSSNFYNQSLKRKFNIKKLGYSGTLDPFASGVIVFASGIYTKLLGHLNLSPKVYIATLWLGAYSNSFDITNISKVNIVKEFEESKINEVLHSMKGIINYIPPSFSAKKVNGLRAYKLAREGKNIELNEISSEIFDINLLNYSHPFLSFKISVQKGSYIRSIGDLIAKKLGVCGALSNLIRIKEGEFSFNDYKLLNPLDFIEYERLFLKNYFDDFNFGRKIILKNDKFIKNKRYIVIFDDFFSIIEINNLGEVKYILNKQSLINRK